MKKVLLLLFMTLSMFANQKVLMVATSHDTMGSTKEKTGIWLSELTHAYIEFENAGYEITLASPKEQAIPIDERSIINADKESLEFLTNGLKRVVLDNPKPLKDINAKQYDVIYLVGGHGVMWDFPRDNNLKRILVQMAIDKKIISAVCHGSTGFVDVNYDNGKSIIENIKLTGFSNTEESAVELTKVVPFLLEDELVKNGAIYSKSKKDFASHVVVDKNFITGQNPASAKQVAEAIVKKLEN